jgi:vitamin B12/bleomycin/antimicrobial peptide transport system ATP-binding/permease protein
MNDNTVNGERVSAWSLIKPYWVSEEKWIAWGLLTLVIAMNFAIVYINVRINKWSAQFYDALAQKNVQAFPGLLTTFTVLALIFIVLAIYSLYFRQMLGFRWRQWLTERFIDRWLDDDAFYRIERDHLADNPDQRIADDLQSLASTTLSLSIDLLSTVVTLASFVSILWALGGALTFALGSTPIAIPGYMVWVAALYALAGSYVMHRFGHPLVSISYQQQKVEADFRFGLIRLRENAEQIALYDGANVEARRAHSIFMRIRDNFWLVMRFTKRLTFINSFYAQAAYVFPIAVAAPRYFAGAYALGVLMQIRSAFGTVSDSFSWFINSYGSLVQWRATVNRLREFRRVVDATRLKESVSPGTEHGGINLHLVDTDAITVRALRLSLPDGTPLSSVGSLTIAPGSRWLVRGASGSGKSTLLRALAGLWPFGEGTIEKPVDARIMFVPQKSYIPIGTLKGALCYPSGDAAFSDDACAEVLRTCRLSGLVERLHDSEHWERLLSPGEQQRLAIARVLLQKPDFLFLDEATSALDLENESVLYRALAERLPNGAIVSVAHRESVQSMHDQSVEVVRDHWREPAELATA